MVVTIGFGWWLLPATITLASFITAAFMSRDLGNDRFGAGAVIAFLFFLIAAVVSLLTWLIWAVLT